MDSFAGHIAGEAALRLAGHRLVEGHIQEAEVWPLLGILHQRGGLSCTCITHHRLLSFDTMIPESYTHKPDHAPSK